MKDNERMVVSAHQDGEVESPWKQEVDRRIAENPEWAAEAERHQKVKAALAAASEPDWSAASERVKARLVSVSAPRSSLRHVSMAWVSVAAAALLMVAAGGGFWLGRQAAPAPNEVTELQVQVPKSLGLELSGEGQLLMASTLQGNRR